MIIDEAIIHAKEKAEELRNKYELFDHWDEEEEERANGCLVCAEEHEQLAKWLEDYKRLLEERPQAKWIPVSERLPEEKLFNPSRNYFGFDFEDVLCTTVWGDVRAYKYGKPIGHDKPHFWFGGGIMDEYVIAWQYKPEPYKKGGAE